MSALGKEARLPRLSQQVCFLSSHRLAPRHTWVAIQTHTHGLDILDVELVVVSEIQSTDNRRCCGGKRQNRNGSWRAGYSGYRWEGCARTWSTTKRAKSGCFYHRSHDTTMSEAVGDLLSVRGPRSYCTAANWWCRQRSADRSVSICRHGIREGRLFLKSALEIATCFETTKNGCISRPKSGLPHVVATSRTIFVAVNRD